jgi:pimeloyl-ACP methyl ester carboxylesterase
MPAVIALPGTLLDARSLSQALAALSPRTELLGTCPLLDDELDRLAALAPEPAWWVGHSLGGIVALQLAARHPTAVAGLVLLAANARAAGSQVRLRAAAHRAGAEREGLRPLATGRLGPAYGLHAEDPLVQSVADQAQAVGLERFAHQLAYACQRPALDQRGPWIAVPVLALSADDDLLCPPVQSDEIVALALPGTASGHDRLARAGHLFPMQQPAWVAGRVVGFLRRHAQHESSR